MREDGGAGLNGGFCLMNVSVYAAYRPHAGSGERSITKHTEDVQAACMRLWLGKLFENLHKINA